MLPSSSKSPSSSPYKSKNKFNYNSIPCFPIQLNSKLQIISLQISQHGRSGGVIFIQSQKGSFVLKANNQASQDYFYNQLALLLDVNVPLMDTIGCYQQQFQNIVYLIQKYCHGDQVLYARLKTKLDYPFYQIMEYIPSISLANVGIDKYTNNMITDYKMYTIGICLAYDIIINNNDRFALIWRGQGNINNILIQIHQEYRNYIKQSKDRNDNRIKLGNFMYIDHDGHLVNYQDQLAKVNVDKYMDIVGQFQLNMVQYLRKQNSSYPNQFEKLIKQVCFFTQYKFNEEDIIRICQGIIYCTKKFIDLYQSQAIQNLHKSIIKPTDTKNKQINYWNQHWNSQFKKVNLNFCQVFYIKVSAIYATYPQLINKIYDKVKKSIQMNKDMKRNRSYQNSRKSSQILSQRSKDNNSQLDKQESNKNEQPQEEEEQQKKEGDRRKWREKLQKFKVQNYR